MGDGRQQPEIGKGLGYEASARSERRFKTVRAGRTVEALYVLAPYRSRSAGAFMRLRPRHWCRYKQSVTCGSSSRRVITLRCELRNRVAQAIPAAAGRECTMTKHKFQDIWKEQCVAARNIRVQHGVLSALDYLIGEKLLTYADTAVTRPEFARELPRFVAEVRDIFSDEEIRPYLDHLERMAAIRDEQVPKDDDDDFLRDSAEQLAAKRARLAQLKELLTSTMLGTA
jgi:hypothetical protein